MLSIALAMLALVGGQQNRIPIPQAPMLFDKEHLGESGMAAFLEPDSVTFQRVYPPQDQEKAEFAVGQWRVSAAGPEHDLPLGTVYQVRSALQTPRSDMQTLCAMHPDHVLRFKKGKDVVSVVTCYTCHLLVVSSGSQGVGGTTMPAGQPFSDLLGLITTEEDCRATWDESGGPGTYDLLAHAKSATYQRVAVTGQNAFNPEVQPLGEPKRMTEVQFAKFRTLLLNAPILKGKVFNSFGFESPAVGSDLLVTFDGGGGRFLFRKKAFDMHLRLSEAGNSGLPSGLQLWEALREELELMSRG